MDYNFFKGQLEYPQTTSMSVTKDETLERKRKAQVSKAEKALFFIEKHKGEYHGIIPKETGLVSTKCEISEDNIMTKTDRQCSSKAEVEEKIDEESFSSTEDEEWDLPYRSKRSLKQKPDSFTINLPSSKIPTLLASTSTTTRTSPRNEVKLISTLLKAGGADLNQTSLSVSTIRRQRKASVSINASEIREKIKGFKGSSLSGTFLVLHWDGKIIQLISGETEDRLAIAISAPNLIPGQFVASPAIPDGTGETMGNCVFNKVGEFGLHDDIQAVVFDTTASNTGRWRGSVTRFEAMLGRKIIWLACRHHIPELFIKHASIYIRGPTKGPEDALFKEFKKKFGFINLNEKTLWTWPSRRQDWRRQRANVVLEWADEHIRISTWPREDYRELLELVVVFLGGVVKRLHAEKLDTIEVYIRKPGAIHHARFMASCLYLLKIALYKKQFDTTPKDIKNVEILAEYVALLHAPYFLQSPLAVSAPRNDRDFWVDLCSYKRCFNPRFRQHGMITAVQDSVRNHLWYLTEELVIFSLFDDDVTRQERQTMASKMLLYPHPPMFQPGKPVLPVNLMIDNPSLDSFVGEKSWLLFNILRADGEWLQQGVDAWENNDEYVRMKSCVRDLKVVNDLAERCIKDIQEYADLAKDSKYQEDILLVATDHRGVFQDLRKQALNN